MNRTIKWVLIFISSMLVLLLIAIKATWLFGEVQHKEVHLPPGNIEVPHKRNINWKSQSPFADSIIFSWAVKPITAKVLEGKGNGPRILLAKLFVKRDLAEVNSAIVKGAPWGVSGSSWAFNKKGDYDFSLTIYTTILWLFGEKPAILYPETKDHLLKVLLTEAGNKFRYTAPKTAGLVKETENHLLMTEVSRYLKNRWIKLHGNEDAYYDNIANGMETKLLALLEEMKTIGLYEFNSLPYIGYTITALLNLEAFASERVRQEARNVLDYMNWCYALGSYQLKHYPPMRRRYEKAGITRLTTGYHSVFMKSWLSFAAVSDYNKDIRNGEVHALMGACMPYRPADKVVDMIFNKGNGYFIKLGHGPDACPEIYSAGKHFLLSAGGANRGKRSLIVARPICLFLNDIAEDLSETFHLAGPGTDFMKWNNTGVYKNFACAAGPVFVPAICKPVAKDNNWALYLMGDSIAVAVYSTEKLGLLAVFEGVSSAGLLETLTRRNPDPEKLKNYFQFPGGRKLSYDVNAPKNKWVIISDDYNVPDRDFDQWPLVEGVFK